MGGNNLGYEVTIRKAYLTSDRDGNEILTEEDISIFVDPDRVYYAGLKYTF